MTGPDCSVVDRIDALAEEFLTAHRRGAKLDIEVFVARAPELADRIRRLFPTLLAFEDVASIVAPPGSANDTAIPDQLGEYHIVREVGRGGMGIVYEAVQMPLSRRVALKVLPSGPRSEGPLLERFQREARTAAKLHHGNIVPVYGVGADRGTYFYAMQFIPGHGLNTILNDVRRLRGRTLNVGADPTVGSSSTLAAEPIERYHREIARLGADAADGLAHAHSQGILHRDIKPSNLLLDVQSHIWVADFGLAKADDADELTQAGDIVGTLRFLAPERFDGQCDLRSDVYSLGVTLYEMLTLEPAFQGSDRAQLIERISRGQPIAPRRVDPSIPRDLENIVLRAMARRPNDRYADADELAADLRRFLGGQPVAARPPGTLEQLGKWIRRHPAAAALLGVLITATLIIAGVVAVFNGRLRDTLAESNKNLVDAKAQNHRANQNLTTLRDAIDKFSLMLDQDKRLKKVDLSDLRKKLYANAAQFYDVVADQLNDDRDAGDTRFQIARKLALIRTEANDYDAALADHAMAVRMGAQLIERYPNVLDYHTAVGQELHNRALLLENLGRRAEAENELLHAVERERYVLRIDPMHRPARHHLAQHLQMLAGCRLQDSQPADVTTLIAEARDLIDRLTNEERRPQIVQARVSVYLTASEYQRKLEQYAEAEKTLRTAVTDAAWLEKENAGDAEFVHLYRHVRVELGRVLIQMERYAEADAELQSALTLAVPILEEFRTHPNYAVDLANSFQTLASLKQRQDRPDEALGWFEKAIAIFPTTTAPTAYGRGVLTNIYWGQAGSLERLNRYDEAIEAWKKAILWNTNPARTDRYAFHLRRALIRARRFDEAEQSCRQAVAIQQQRINAQPNDRDQRQELVALTFQLGQVLCDAGKGDAGRPYLDRSLALQEELTGGKPANTADALKLAILEADRGEVLGRNGSPDDALKWLDQAVARLASLHPHGNETAQVNRKLTQIHEQRALMFRTLGRWTHAVSAWEKVEAMQPDATPQHHLRLERAIDLVRAGQLTVALGFAEAVMAAKDATANNLFECARVFALSTMEEITDTARAEQRALRAVEALRRALDLGFNDWKRLEAERDFDALRARNDYRLLVLSMRAK